MKGVITLFLTIQLGAQGATVTPAAQVVAGSRIDGTLPGITDGGDTVIDTRELEVELQFPSGKRGKGAALLLFDRVTGYYLCLDGWESDDYPKTLTAKVVSFDRKVGVISEGMFMFAFGNPSVYIFRSNEKAHTMDEAESSYLKWAKGHMAEIETHKHYAKVWAEVRLEALRLVPGLVSNELRAQAGIPIEIRAITRKDNHWELTVKGNYKVKVRLSNWPPVDAAGTPTLAFELGPDAVVCLDDHDQEIACPNFPRIVRSYGPKTRTGVVGVDIAFPNGCLVSKE
jgi:hypothetical protein